jgi:hypothetical protein
MLQFLAGAGKALGGAGGLGGLLGGGSTKVSNSVSSSVGAAVNPAITVGIGGDVRGDTSGNPYAPSTAKALALGEDMPSGLPGLGFGSAPDLSDPLLMDSPNVSAQPSMGGLLDGPLPWVAAAAGAFFLLNRG